MRILGINAYHGDASAALVEDGQLVAAAAEERFNRQKHCAGFPFEAIRYCLSVAHLVIADIDAIAVSRDPKRNWYRKLWRGINMDTSLLRQRLASSRSIRGVREQFNSMFPEHGLAPRTEIVHVEHHLAHAASAFFVSPFEDAAILSMDGFGDFSSTLLAEGHGNTIRELQRVYFPHSLGLVYNALTQYLGFPHYGDEGKVMALAALGKPKYIDLFREIVFDAANQSFELDLRYFTHHKKGIEMNWASGSPSVGRLFSKKLEEALGPARQKDEPLNERFYDVAASLQLRIEEVVLRLVNGLAEKCPSRNLCLAGGVALNSVANARILGETPYQELYIQPAAADDGTAVGAAFYVWNQLEKGPRSFVMEHANWGPEFSESQIDEALKSAGLTAETSAAPESDAAKALADGKIVGWFQGRMEFGPRALGNRSILADPRKPDMKKILNDRVKHREPFRPFAPSVLQEKTGDYFEKNYPSPFMLLVYGARKDKASKIPAVLHTDGTGRLQTVTARQNPVYDRLIREFEKASQVPMVLNTSFNDSEPIVCTPQDAIHCFQNSRIDVLVLGNRIVRRG